MAVPGLLVPFCRKYALLLTPAGEVVAYLFQPRPIGVLVPRLPARVSAWALRGIRPWPGRALGPRVLPGWLVGKGLVLPMVRPR